MAAAGNVLQQSSPPSRRPLPMVIPASIAWNAVIALASIAFSIFIFNLQETNAAESSRALTQLVTSLGRPVQSFIAFLGLIPTVLAIYSSYQLWQGQPSGRYIALVLHYVGFILSLAALLSMWGFFLSFEQITDSIMRNAWMLWGLPIAYAIYWIAGRLPENSDFRARLEQFGIALGMFTLIVVLFFANILAAASSVISAYGNISTWLATIAAVIFGVLAWQMLHLGAYFGETPAQQEAWQGWLMLSPNIIGFTIFFAGPLLLSFYLSFTDSTVGKVPEVIGLQNYANAIALEFKWLDTPGTLAQNVLSFGYTPLTQLTIMGRTLIVGAKDSMFWMSMFNTFMFCLLLVPLSVIPALGLSLILNSKLPGVKFYRAIYFLPSVAAVVGTALIWRWLYDPTIGYINYVITQLVRFLNSVGIQITDPQIAWLTGPGVVLFSVVILSAWQVVGFNTVLFLAGLQGIPKELYEAASIDGADRWGQFRNVTVPMLAPTTFFVIITTVITGLQVFNEPYALFPARPIPVDATTAVFYLHNRGFFRFEFGYASAIAWMLFAIIFLVTLLQFRISRSNAYEG